jgi:hypothetical protein
VVPLRSSLVVAALLAATGPAAADGGADARHLRYEAYWGGFHAADFVLSYENGRRYENAFRLATRGVADWFLKLRVKAASEGTARPVDGTDGGALWPDLYRVDYSNRRRERSVRVRFDGPEGRAVPTIRTTGATPDQDREKEAKVPPFRLAVYDGRRRFDLVGEYRGRGARTILRHRHRVHRLRLTAKPVSGFKDSHWEVWNDAAYDVYLSDDDRLVPLQFVSVGLGPVINLVEQCDRPCALPEG